MSAYGASSVVVTSLKLTLMATLILQVIYDKTNGARFK